MSTTRGTTLTHPRYAAGAVLGRGAQGIVLRVEDRESPGRALVAKVATSKDEGGAWLVGEFARLARLRLPGVVAAHDLGRDTRTAAPFLVEDYVEGPDAVAWLAEAKDDAARVDRVVRLLAGGALALAALHDAGFVHGDLKPAHVRMATTGATLLDLGCAVARRGTGAATGYSRPFAAPEVLAGAPPGPRADLYGLAATAWAAVTGAPPNDPARRIREGLGRATAWVPASVQRLLASMLAPHPEDRPEDARAVLSALRHETATRARELLHTPLVGREVEVTKLLATTGPVVYVTGPAGIGKTALTREVVTRALLAGREARFVDRDFPRSAELVAFLRGSEDAWPFVARPSPAQPMLLAVDDPAAVFEELPLAIEAFRCRSDGAAGLALLVAAREAPPGGASLPLDPLGHEDLVALCATLDVHDDEETARFARASLGNPGWLLAEVHHLPLDRQAVVARAEELAPNARSLLVDIASLGGDVPAPLLASDEAALDDLFAAGLVLRHTGRIALAAPHLAGEIARALGTFGRSEALAARLLVATDVPARVLFALATGDHAPTERAELLDRAARAARHEGSPALETEALLHALADPRARDAARVTRLERLTRDAGRKAAHAEVVRWLLTLAHEEPRVRPLALRREAEAEARTGAYDRALELADQAASAARDAADPAAEAFAASTRGAVLLYRADWAAAAESLGRARARLATLPSVDDAEEVARLDHNLGVVALYQDDLPRAVEALTRSIAKKRALGDLAGVRACLLNLGIAETRARHFDEARRALREAESLARSLGQAAGLGWSLAARADLALREGDAREAEGIVAEAAALGDALPATVRSDLALLRAEIAVVEGRGDDALSAVAALDQKMREDDAMTDARAALLEARAHACRIPADRRASARAAIRALRRARDAGLADITREAETALRTARGVTMNDTQAVQAQAKTSDESTWQLLDKLAHATTHEDAVHHVLERVLAETSGERAFFVLRRGEDEEVHALDLDALPLADADKRLPREELERALAREATSYTPRVASHGGAGSRLILPAGRDLALVVEHRFLPNRFDHVSAETLSQLAVLARLAARIDASASDARASSARDARPRSGPLGASHVAQGREVTDEVYVSTLTPSTSGPHRRSRAIVGESRALVRALARLEAALDSDLPLLVIGETGSGKELFAAAAHELGPRARAPFVAVNCAALPASLFEAELFGHTRGAFTGASGPRKGLLARAEGGTLFLDEIGELAAPQQAALLRVLESRKYRPVGSDDERPFDARIVAATNRDLERAVAEGSFRQDLFFRLRVLEVRVPPLREREGDVALLARHFLEASGCKAELTPRALDALAGYSWPGNVRELAHQMQRIAAMRPKRVEAEHLGREVRAAATVRGRRRPESDERAEVERALEATAGNISRAATVLGLTRHGLKKRMLRLGLRARLGSSS